MWQDCSLTVVQRKTAFVEQSWWAWTEYAWINAMVFVPMAKAPPKAGAKLLYSPNLIHELTCLLSPQVILAGLLRHAFVDTSWNNQSLLLKWTKIERWTRPSMLSSMCQHVARLQFDSCAQKRSLCGTVMTHDGLNLRCLDQCHGVRSHGKSSYLVIRQPEFDPWVYNRLQEPCCKLSCIFSWFEVTFKQGFEGSSWKTIGDALNNDTPKTYM